MEPMTETFETVEGGHPSYGPHRGLIREAQDWDPEEWVMRDIAAWPRPVSAVATGVYYTFAWPLILMDLAIDRFFEMRSNARVKRYLKRHPEG